MMCLWGRNCCVCRGVIGVSVGAPGFYLLQWDNWLPCLSLSPPPPLGLILRSQAAVG